MKSATTSTITIVHRVEFKRPFITVTPVAPLQTAAGLFQNLCAVLHSLQAAQRASRLRGQCRQITGTGNASVNFFKFKASAKRSSWRNMPQQCGTSRGASSTNNGSEVL